MKFGQLYMTEKQKTKYNNSNEEQKSIVSRLLENLDILYCEFVIQRHSHTLQLALED